MDIPLLGLLIFVGLNLTDLWLTHVILKNNGREWNPLCKVMYKYMGIAGIGVIKLIIIFWFGLQYCLNVLDIFSIYYLNFSFAVVLLFMYRDLCIAGLREKLNPFYKESVLYIADSGRAQRGKGA